MPAPTVPQTLRAVLWTSVALMLVLSWNARASAGEPGSESAPPLRAEAAIGIVQQIYDKAERYTVASGTPVDFVVSDCRAIYQRDFAREAYSELFDLPSSRVLELTPTVLSDPSLGLSGASYPARWTEAEDPKGTAAVRAAVQGASVEEILSRLRAASQEFDVRIEPIVSCGVSVAAQGESLSYRAAFFFSPGTDGTPRFYSDHAVQGLGRLASESLPPIRDFAELRGRMDPELGPGSPSGVTTKVLCATGNSAVLRRTIFHTDQAEHLTGEHLSYFQLGAQCYQTSDCKSSCTPVLVYKTCDESGDIDYTPYFPKTHRKYTQVSAVGDEAYNGPSTCKGALACAVESCLYAACSGIGFTLSLPGFQFQVSSGHPLWVGNVADSAACPAAEQIIVEPPPRCGGLKVSSTNTFSLAGAAGPTLAGRQLAFGLSRGEERADGSFILDEWAVLSFDGEQPTVKLASSTAYGERVLSAAASFRPSGNQGSTVLVVEDAEHPLNSRHIPLPTLAPFEREIGRPEKSAARQELWFRAEIDRDGKVDRLTVLDASKHLDSQLIQTVLRENLKLQFADERRHRAVVFGIAVVGANGRLTVRNPLVSLPKCCCGDSFCA